MIYINILPQIYGTFLLLVGRGRVYNIIHFTINCWWTRPYSHWIYVNILHNKFLVNLIFDWAEPIQKNTPPNPVGAREQTIHETHK